MRLRDLFEAPELRPWTIDPEKVKWKDRGFEHMSFEGVERLFDVIGEKIVNGKKIVICLNKKNVTCVALIKDINPNNKQWAMKIVSKIFFYYPRPATPNLPKDMGNVLQVSKVYTEPSYETEGIASYMYALVAKKGFTVLSDRVQYLGGYKLWNKMTAEAHLNDYSITIWNEKTGYLKDENGILEYNSKNIEESIIWKPTTIGQQTLLVLKETHE